MARDVAVIITSTYEITLANYKEAGEDAATTYLSWVLLALKTAFTMTRTKDVNNVEQLSFASFNKETFCSAAMLARYIGCKSRVGRLRRRVGASPRVPLLSE